MEISFESYTKEYRERFFKYYDELKWLYFELYGEEPDMLESLCQDMFSFYKDRSASLKMMDRQRIQDPDWYKSNKMMGMKMYVNAFGGDLNGVREKLDYLQECGVSYLHLMPLLDTPEGENDGGYAVSDYRKVNPRLGTMEDLEALAGACHDRGISICLDYVMNHTSDQHPWAQKALAGDQEYRDRYFFYDNYWIPGEFEKTKVQVMPETAPGNFTWLPEQEQFVMTTFFPYQWDLNYGNPVVLNEMIDNMLFLINQGIDIIRIGALPYIWKQMGTSCKDLPQVHNIVRILRIVCEIVCPGVLLLGEVVTEPENILPYFGTAEKPECHLLYNVTGMATTWSTVATKDTRLLRRQTDLLGKLPKEDTFLNYLRCHDDIDWKLDFNYLEHLGFESRAHKRFLNDFFTGNYDGSFARGELYNADPDSGDARICGTAASLSGVEKAWMSKDPDALEKAIRLDLMLHAFTMFQTGLPILYSGDEIGQFNDYSYHNDPEKQGDARFLHRGNFDWEAAARRKEEGTIQQQLFDGIQKMEGIRKNYDVFKNTADVWTIDTWDQAVLAVVRQYKKEKMIGIFNFSEYDKVAWIDEEDGMYTELLHDYKMEAKGVMIPAYGVFWLLRDQT